MATIVSPLKRADMKSAGVRGQVGVRKSSLRLEGSASIAEAKAKLSEIVNSVEQRRTEITLIRRGVPVARIVPMDVQKIASGYGWMRGSAIELGDIVGPSGEEWDVKDEE